MKLERVKGEFSVCRLSSEPDLSGKPFAFLSRTDEEVSLVCLSGDVPAEAAEAEPGWSCYRVRGQLDFSLVGILAGITGALAEERIPVFAVSTYLTDYIFIKNECAGKAEAVFGRQGWLAAEKQEV